MVREATASGIFPVVGIAGFVVLAGVGLAAFHAVPDGPSPVAAASERAAGTAAAVAGHSRARLERAATASAFPPEVAEALAQEFRRPPGMGYPAELAGPPDAPREFFFTRAIYSSGRSWGFDGRWRVDYPKADIQFLWGLRRLSNIDAYEGANAVELTDPELRSYPFLYALEVGYMRLSAAEIEGLRDYLQAGGFLMIDDFWGSYEWSNFEGQIQQVLPDHRIEELPLSHPLFRTFYEIDEVIQVPGVRHAWYGTPTWEKDGYVPHVRAITNDDGRLMVVINWNTDLGDAWEWAEDPYYPLDRSTYAYQIAVNTIIYAMSH